MSKAFRSDIWRCIKKSRKRFISIAAITLLGVTMLTGLKAACDDLGSSADAFFDKQGLHDVSVVSTLGMTERDVAELSNIEGVEAAEGAYEESTYTQVDGVRKSVDVKALSDRGFNVPLVLEGSLPSKPHHVAVTERYVADTGLSIGDEVSFEEADEDAQVFERGAYEITAIVVDPTNINGNHSMAFRAGNTADYAFFVARGAVTADVFTAVYVRMKDAAALMCYSEEYEQLVGQVEDRIEGIREAGEEARTDEVVGDAQAELDDARAEAEDEFSSAESQFADARAEIDDGKADLANGWAELEAEEESAKAQFAQAEKDIADGYAELKQAEAELRTQEEAANLDAKEKELDAQIVQLETQLAHAQQGLDQVNSQIAQLEANKPHMSPEQYEASKAELLGGKAQAEAGISEIEGYLAQARAGKQQIADARAQFAAGWASMEEGRAALDAGAAELAAQKRAAYAAIADAKEQLRSGEAKLADGEFELNTQYEEYLTKKADALGEIGDAQKDIDSIEPAQWYVRDRASIGSYASIDSDTSSIETIGTAFSLIFLVVAILISLTTITRMVEEERGLIGTYKALGYRKGEILAKYLLYAAGACICGGVLGLVGGYVLLPKFIFVVFQYMYIIPELHLQINALYALGAVAVFFVGIVGAAFSACRAELAQTPASLMRPKAPGNGSRIFLERISFVWNRLSFLNKVTARNLFRYKKRLLMTVAGIAGCTALLVCGFVIKDSVDSLATGQYGHVYSYDIMCVMDEDDLSETSAWIQDQGQAKEMLEMRVDSIAVSRNGAEEDMQLMVIPRGESFEGYIALEDQDGNAVSMEDCGMVVTRNASVILGFDEGDALVLQTSDLAEAEVKVDAIVENYLGNFMVMTQDVYEKAFGPYEANAVFVNVKDGVDPRTLDDELAQREDVLSTACIAKLMDTFSSAFYLINAVVVLLIGMSAALAFVVLFTLSTTNISERLRELATIKVLGFRRGEVHRYVNKETVILTGIGIVLGLPLGRWLGGLLTVVLEMPGVYFAVNIVPTSYVICAVLTLLFALFVNTVTNRTLDRINMVEALKSIE